jgi:hypothetical protein
VRVFLGMLLGFLLFGLLLSGAYALRVTPEVVNCDRGRQSVEVHVSKAYEQPNTGIYRRKIGTCNVWYYTRSVD